MLSKLCYYGKIMQSMGQILSKVIVKSYLWKEFPSALVWGVKRVVQLHATHEEGIFPAPMLPHPIWRRRLRTAQCSMRRLRIYVYGKNTLNMFLTHAQFIRSQDVEGWTSRCLSLTVGDRDCCARTGLPVSALWGGRRSQQHCRSIRKSAFSRQSPSLQ